ncbi:MEDS domain-containing protein [Anaeromyxobacter terrae]|uniref:MEDS domain-containing protein n=1 Tax=Anaeromyxobacter terrae TaxID=2925406 RepID=UPI001F5AFCA6|nr:MEDS domain-containing protein [Anaeromyxobacter sp. SG22]
MHASTDSGIDGLGRLRWGSHVCHFYRTERELEDVLVPFLRRGLEQGERCVWVTAAPLGADAARRALAAEVPDLEAREARGQLEILDHDGWYRASGGDDTARVLQSWLAREEAARRAGFAGLRLTGNSGRGGGACCDPGFMEYESRVSATFARRRLLGLCSYPLDGCGAGEALEIVRHHDKTLSLRGGAWEAVAPRRTAGEESLQRERLERRTAELEAALREREELLVVASHELRTPMASLQLLVDSLLRPRERASRSAEDERRRLERAAAQCERIARLLDDLLHVSRPGRRAELLPSDADLSSIVRDVAERMQEPLARAGCTLTLSVPPATPGRWDRLRLEQVLTNLLANAARHAGGGPVELSIAASAAGPVLSVRDHGPGVPADARVRVFAPYAQLEGARRLGGVGVGLWVVRRIVEAHGGRVEIRETPGGGATFVVALPWDATRQGATAAAS